MHFAYKLPAVIIIVWLQIKNAHTTTTTTTTKCEGEQQQQQQKYYNKIQTHMNVSVDACDNFFDYACSNWQLPSALVLLKAHDALTAASANNKLKLLEYFEETMLRGNKTDTDTHTHTDGINNEHLHVRTFYTSCVQKNTQEKHTTLANYLSALQQKNTTSNLPLSLSKHFEQISNSHRTKARVSTTYNDSDHNNNNNNNNKNSGDNIEWWKTAAELRLWGVQSFWQLLVRSNWQSSDKKIFYLIPLNFANLAGVSIEEKEFLLERYYKYLLLDLGLKVRKAQHLANELMRFEVSLIELANSEQTMILHAPQTVAYWSTQIPQLHLQQYFQILLKDFKDLPADKVLLVVDLVYLHKLQTLLASKPQSFLEIFMLLKYLAHFEVHQHMDDNPVDYTLYCLEQIETFMPLPLTQLFLELISNNSTLYLTQMKNVLNELFEQLKAQFESLLNATQIFEFDAISKVLGMEKLRAMRLILPQLHHLNDKIEYNLTTAYSKNMLQLWSLHVQQELQQLLTSNTHDTHDSNAYSPLAVNAFYRLQKNAIELPVGMLGPAFYDNCTPPAQFYGRLVFIMAHELLHAFDFDGMNYDKSGNVTFGWGPKSIIRYSSKAGCYMNRRYKTPALHINENIADTEGLRLAFETLKAKLGKNNANSTADLYKEDVQLFFLSFAQTWCGKALEKGTHVKHSERVNNAVANFPEFSTYFNCHEYHLLNPKEKCRIW